LSHTLLKRVGRSFASLRFGTRQEDPDYAGTWAALTPMRRVGTLADIPPVVLFLASEGASFISGQTIGIDGALLTQAQWPYKK